LTCFITILGLNSISIKVPFGLHLDVHPWFIKILHQIHHQKLSSILIFFIQLFHPFFILFHLHFILIFHPYFICYFHLWFMSGLVMVMNKKVWSKSHCNFGWRQHLVWANLRLCLGQSKIKYIEKVDVSTLTLRCSYNYHKVGSN
jgi:hypothetical protein